MSQARDTILRRVHEALAPLPQRAPLPDWPAHLPVAEAVFHGDTDLATVFERQLRAVNGRLVRSSAELAAFLAEKGWTRGVADRELLETLPELRTAPFHLDTTFDRARVDDYAFGITRARGAIAETGTVVFTDAGTFSRLAALAPWVHVTVLARADLWRDVPAAVARLDGDPNIIWATGPSKTADVEGILIEGVHGPGEQIVLLVG